MSARPANHKETRMNALRRSGRATRVLLTADQELELFLRGDQASRDELVASFEPLLGSLARHLAPQDERAPEKVQDFTNAATLGFLKGLERYDPNLLGPDGKPYRIGTYCRWWAINELGTLNWLERMKGMTGIMTRSNRISVSRRLQDVLKTTGDVTPEDLVAIAKEEGVSLRSVIAYHHSRFVSLEPLPYEQEDGGEGTGVVIVDEAMNPEEALVEAERIQKPAAVVAGFMKELKAQDRLILQERFLSGAEKATPREKIGEMLGISEERVRQREMNALKGLRLRLEAAGWSAEDFL